MFFRSRRADGPPTLVEIRFVQLAVALMLVIDAIIGYYTACQVWTYTYEKTAGTLLSSDIERVSCKGGCSYNVDVTYSYHVGKNKYFGHAIRYGQSTSFRTEARAAATYPVGANVVVFYNPRNPNDAVLLRGLQGTDLFLGLFLLPFNLTFGLAGLGMILCCVTPAKWLAGWNAVPIGIQRDDDGKVATLRYYSIPPWAAAVAGSGGTAFFMIFLVGFADEVFDPLTSFAIWGWCGVLMAAAIVYWIVWRSPTSLEIDRSTGRVTLHSRRQPQKSFSIADVADITYVESDIDPACSALSCPPQLSFRTIAVLRDRGQGEERVQLHTDATLPNALCMVKWMRERLISS